MSGGREVVEAYYRDLFCEVCNADRLDERVSSIVSDEWQCVPEPIGGPGAAGLAKTIEFFRDFAPDLKYVPVEILQDGNRYVVRSKVTGTAQKTFFGVDPGKSFEISAIDIHHIDDGKIVETHRVEDWARAVKQMSR